MYQILVLDYYECCFAQVYSDAEIKIIYNEKSLVPKKHKAGGQSAPRFSRIRQNEIKKWFKDINEFLKTQHGEIYIGISSVYYSTFLKNLNTYNKQKIKEQFCCEYADDTGIYDMINRIEIFNKSLKNS